MREHDRGSERWAVDTHAHLYWHYELDRALDGAVSNLDRAASLPTERLLLMADPLGVDSRRLLDLELEAKSRRWRVGSAGVSWRHLVRCDGVTILAIRGRQVATQEGFEVLVFDDSANSEAIPEGRSLVETLGHATELGGLVIVPWGFGKWWFGRRRLLLDALRGGALARSFLGDSGARPAFGRPSQIFREGSALGVGILPGSDPLPIIGQEERLGSSGLVIAAGLDRSRLIASLLSVLDEPEVEVTRYRSGVGFGEFARSQLALRRVAIDA